MSQQHVDLDVLIAFVQGLRASRDGHQDTAKARTRLETYQAAHAAVKAAGERLAELLLAELAEEQKRHVERLEKRDAERAAVDERKLLAAVCGFENHVHHADGGPSPYGVAQFYADIAAWAVERSTNAGGKR